MLTNFFGNSKHINKAVITCVFFVIYLVAVLNNTIPFQWETIPLFLAFFSIAFFINIKNKLTFDNAYFLLFLVIIVGVFPTCIEATSKLYENLLLLFFLRKTYSLRSVKNTLKKVFDASFWLGSAFLLEPLSVTYIILLYIALISYGKTSWRTLIIPLVGTCIPAFLFFSYSFFTDEYTIFEKIINQLFEIELNFNFSRNNILGLTLILISSLITILIKSSKFLTVINTFRPVWVVVVSNFFIALILLVLTYNGEGSAFIYLIFPAALILANGLELFEKNLSGEIILSLYFITILAMFFL